MNMTRRKFFRGVAIGLPAALVASKLPALPALAGDRTIRMPAARSPYNYQRTIYHSWPIATWRKLYVGPIDRTPLPYWRTR